MTALNLQDANDIDQQTKDCVLGYIHRVEKLLPTDDIIYFVIPPLIIHWIILYYHIQEEFDVNCYEMKKYELNENNTVIKQKELFALGSAYMKKIAKSGIHRWKFKMINCAGMGYVTIGVWKNNHKPCINASTFEKSVAGKSYGWIANAKVATDGDDDDRHRYGSREACSGDVIEMILNLNKREIRYCVNGEDFGVAFSDIEATQYKAVVSTNGATQSVEFISYKHHRDE